MPANNVLFYHITNDEGVIKEGKLPLQAGGVLSVGPDLTLRVIAGGSYVRVVDWPEDSVSPGEMGDVAYRVINGVAHKAEYTGNGSWFFSFGSNTKPTE